MYILSSLYKSPQFDLNVITLKLKLVVYTTISIPDVIINLFDNAILGLKDLNDCIFIFILCAYGIIVIMVPNSLVFKFQTNLILKDDISFIESIPTIEKLSLN